MSILPIRGSNDPRPPQEPLLEPMVRATVLMIASGAVVTLASLAPERFGLIENDHDVVILLALMTVGLMLLCLKNLVE